jgi:subtilisin-like proprotein convertase family protein
MKRATSWAICLTVVMVLFLLSSNFIPRARMGSKPPRISVPQAVSSVGYHSPAGRHKISVSDQKLVESLKAQGGRVIADYGSSVLLEASEAVANNLSSSQDAQIVDDNNLVLLNSGTIDTTTPDAQAMRSAGNGGGKQMRLVQFAGPIRPEWYKALGDTGVRIVTYIPNNAYLVYGEPLALQAVQRLASSQSSIQWDGPYSSFQRLSRDLSSAAAKKQKGGSDKSAAPLQNAQAAPTAKGNQLFAIQLVTDEQENAITMALIDGLKLEPVMRKARVMDYLNVVVALPESEVISQISKRSDVVSISRWNVPHKMDERQNMIIAGNLTGGNSPTPGDYLAYLASHGFTTATTSFGVNISDSGVDNGSTTPNHFGLYALGNPTAPANSRIVYARVVGTPSGPGSTTQACDGHGNLNTHIIGGYVPTGTVGGVNFGAAPHADAQGFRYGLGVLPFVKVGSSVIFDNSGAPTGDFTFPDYSDLESRAYSETMRVSSNSWGASDNSYTIDAQEYDALVRDAQPTGATVPAAGNQEYVILFAAGNDGPGAASVGEPGTAKNVITVGASENVQSLGGTDACGIGDAGADNANDVIGFSGRGPTADGRIKPEIIAPGTHITGGVGQASIASPTGSGSGAAIACFNATGVCAGPGTSDFFPVGQQWYTSSDGTSHSTPAMAGYAALIRQFFINSATTPPSPAMTKALMMNSARYLNGVGANDNLYSNTQGMGEANFNSFFDIFTTAHAFHDQVGADMFTASGQQRVITGTVSDNAKPFRVTLAWTDTPGPTSGNAFVNNLDLEVTIGGNTYKGNVFTGAFSASGGTADTRNNAESVILPAGTTGNFVIKVKATNIAGDGVPNTGGALDQDFALVAYNVTEAPVAVIAAGASAITAESCAINGAIDPNETVTVNLDLSNVGTLNTTNLVATLLPTGGVTSPSGPQNYGVVVAGGPAVTKPFTFTAASGACGSSIIVSLQLQDGATDLGTATYNFTTGTIVVNNYSSGDISVAIPDSPAPAINIPLTVADVMSLTDVNVSFRLDHTFDGDLTIALVHPDGTVIPLVTNRGSSGVNFGTGTLDCAGVPTLIDDQAATAISAGSAPFAASFRPESPLSALNGKPSNGTWNLRIQDTAAQDTGTVGCVKLELNKHTVCCGALINAVPPPVITAESISPANNAADPEETVTVNLTLTNNGGSPTTNLVAMLQPTGGVAGPSGPQTYGVLADSGGTATRPFTFTAQGTCGSTLTLTLALQDGATNLGTVTFTMTLGALTTTTTFSENFDGVAAPALPAGWVTAATGVEVAWVTSATSPSSAPNDAFAPDVSNIGNTTLDTPTINVPAAGGQLTFKNLFNMEASGVTPTRGFDGMVLEISINGGAFNDITTGGNAFIAGGYTRTIDATFGSPIAGRLAWSGLSGGTTATPTYITSTINLPAAAAGQPIKLRFRAATDNSAVAAGAAGVRIDNIVISGSSFVCNTQTCTITAPTSMTIPPGTCGAIVNYSPAVSFTGACGVVVGPNPASGSFFGIGTTTVLVRGTRADASFTDASFPVTVQESETQATGLGANVTNNYCNTSVTYTAVTGAGSTTVVDAPQQTLPPPYAHCPSCPELNITTTSTFTAPVTTCIQMPASTDINTFHQLRILHGEPGLVNRTVSSNFATKTLCARTTTVSPFVVAIDTLAPTAAPASVSGRITTPDGEPLAGVSLSLGGGGTDRVITDANGNYRFSGVETDSLYTLTPVLLNYHFSPESLSFSLLANKTDAVFTATRDGVSHGNVIDTADYFVRQHYVDFLNREPDVSGFNFWSNQIVSCGADAECRERRTINVSAAYFLSIEFQETGGLVDGLYRVSYGRRPQYAEFMPDTRAVANNVVVGVGAWQAELEASKQAFANAWVQRAEFQSAYGGLGNEGYVDTLLSHTGVSFSQGERDNLVDGLNKHTLTRAQVLRRIAENGQFVSAKRNAAFVMMQYFGYLRRDPDAAGYQFWLNKLNQFGGNFEQAEMVKSFLVSGEYRQRFAH